MDGFRGWEFLIQEAVTNQEMIRLPELVKNTVATNHLTKGPSIHWSIETENRYIVLSESPLQKEAYTNIGVYKIYGIEDIEDPSGRIRPPREIAEAWAADPEEGERVFYLTHKQMCTGKKKSVYLLSESQLLGLLPDQSQATRQQSAPDSLYDLPAFDSSR